MKKMRGYDNHEDDNEENGKNNHDVVLKSQKINK
jgi:hypothetical protein